MVSLLFNVLLGIKKLFFFGPLVALGEERSSLTVAFLPFVNSFKLLAKAFGLLLKERFLVSLLNLLKVLISLVMAGMFFIVYTTAYTYAGFIIYRVLPFISFCLFKALLEDMHANPSEDGYITEFFYKASVTFKYTFSLFAIIPACAIFLSLSAKLMFTRAILIDTVGFLSYKLYVGENPGSTILATVAKTMPLVILSTALGSSVINGVDRHFDNSALNALNKMSIEGGTPLTHADRVAFLEGRPTTLGAMGKTIHSIFSDYTIVISKGEQQVTIGSSAPQVPVVPQLHGPILERLPELINKKP